MYLHTYILNLIMLKRKHSGSEISIFSEMTALAQKFDAVNLSQGFPDYEIDERLQRLLFEGTSKGFNQYAPMNGLPILLDNIVTLNCEREIPLKISKENITVVPGASYGIYSALAAILQPGDEVIVLEPYYDSYLPSIEVNGGTPVFCSLDESFAPNFEHIKNAITDKTRAILINTPHNPSGKVWTEEMWNQLATLLDGTEIMVISDEVYDVLIYDDRKFYSAFHHPKLRDRSFCIFSFGKMFHITGWKVGYVLASPELNHAFGQIHQYLSFCVNAPAQYALAKYLEVFDLKENQKKMQKKRDYFLESIKNLPFHIPPKAEAGYFQTLDFTEISNVSDKEFALWLTEKAQVAAVPVSAFYHGPHNTGMLRFCFAKKEETVLKAVENLKRFFN